MPELAASWTDHRVAFKTSGPQKATQHEASLLQRSHKKKRTQQLPTQTLGAQSLGVAHSTSATPAWCFYYRLLLLVAASTTAILVLLLLLPPSYPDPKKRSAWWNIWAPRIVFTGERACQNSGFGVAASHCSPKSGYSPDYINTASGFRVGKFLIRVLLGFQRQVWYVGTIQSFMFSWSFSLIVYGGLC